MVEGKAFYVKLGASKRLGLGVDGLRAPGKGGAFVLNQVPQKNLKVVYRVVIGDPKPKTRNPKCTYGSELPKIREALSGGSFINGSVLKSIG